MINQPVLVFAHAEEVIGFLYDLRFGLVIGAFSVNQFPFRIKPFTAKTIETLIFTEIDIPPVIDPVQDIFDGLYMGGVCCTDKVVVGNIHPGPKIPEQFTDTVYILFWRLAGLFSGNNDFVSMLIGSCKKKGFRPGKGIKPCQDIGNYG